MNYNLYLISGYANRFKSFSYASNQRGFLVVAFSSPSFNDNYWQLLFHLMRTIWCLVGFMVCYYVSGLEYVKICKLALKAPYQNKPKQTVRHAIMIKINGYSTALLALMGSIDCLTTVIGILYFGAVELNPFIAGVVRTNVPAFVVLKLTTTVFVCLIFVQAEKL